MANHNIHLLSRAVIIQNNHILLAYDPRQNPNHYYETGAEFFYLPGGHIEFQESASSAVLREVKEEMGFYSVIERFLGIIECSWDSSNYSLCCHSHEANLIFQVNIPGLQYPNLPKKIEEHVDFMWIDLNLLSITDFRPTLLKDAIAMWIDEPSNNIFWSQMK